MKIIKDFEKDQYDKCTWPFKDMEPGDKVRFEGVVSVWAERAINSYKNSSGAKKLGKLFNVEWVMRSTDVEPFFKLDVTRVDGVNEEEAGLDL